ncbi:MAG: PqiC family protein [Luteolibacter sp.]
MTRIFAIPVLLALSSCGVLRPVNDSPTNHLLQPLVAERSITGISPSVAVARPSLPGYLEREQIVSRTTDGSIVMNQNQLWAEPLDSGIARIVAMNLGRLENSLNILPVQSFVGMEYDQLLEIRISRFETDPSGDLVLECTWKLQPVHGPMTSPRAFQTRISKGGPFAPRGNQSARVLAMSQAISELSKNIAQSL